eukprot:scaffold19500_cov23-Tisochrysis_lutea.AAC.2
MFAAQRSSVAPAVATPSSRVNMRSKAAACPACSSEETSAPGHLSFTIDAAQAPPPVATRGVRLDSEILESSEVPGAS